MKKIISYTPEEIFNILRINQYTFSKVNDDVDNVLIESDSILDWRNKNNFFEWTELYKVQNKMFNISLSQDEWLKGVNPEKEKSVFQLCEFISKHARKEETYPVKILGKECLKASIFFNLKNNLAEKWQLDVKDLRPSSLISRFTDFENFPKLVAEVSKSGVSISDTIELKHKDNLSILQKLNFFDSNRLYIYTGETKTFRDLVLRIFEFIR